jgi:hypothetical protein
MAQAQSPISLELDDGNTGFTQDIADVSLSAPGLTQALAALQLEDGGHPGGRVGHTHTVRTATSKPRPSITKRVIDKDRMTGRHHGRAASRSRAGSETARGDSQGTMPGMEAGPSNTLDRASAPEEEGRAETTAVNLPPGLSEDSTAVDQMQHCSLAELLLESDFAVPLSGRFPG